MHEHCILRPMSTWKYVRVIRTSWNLPKRVQRITVLKHMSVTPLVSLCHSIRHDFHQDFLTTSVFKLNCELSANMVLTTTPTTPPPTVSPSCSRCHPRVLSDAKIIPCHVLKHDLLLNYIFFFVHRFWLKGKLNLEAVGKGHLVVLAMSQSMQGSQPYWLSHKLAFLCQFNMFLILHCRF